MQTILLVRVLVAVLGFVLCRGLLGFVTVVVRRVESGVVSRAVARVTFVMVEVAG